MNKHLEGHISSHKRKIDQYKHVKRIVSTYAGITDISLSSIGNPSSSLDTSESLSMSPAIRFLDESGHTVSALIRETIPGKPGTEAYEQEIETSFDVISGLIEQTT